jgi:tRNA threonylcarbamoyladenosine biosynthesis protein TsaB
VLLAIDTSHHTSAAVVAAAEAGADPVAKTAVGVRTLSSVTRGDAFGHAENIGSVITQALADAGVTAADLTAVAVGRGPASYTGLRVGMAAAVTFAQARQLPLYGVATLDAVASRFGVAGAQFAATADAKRREQFVGFYSGLDAHSLAIREGELEVLGAEALAATLSARSITLVLTETCDAELIGHYALRALAAGRDIGDTNALYLRSPDVTPSAGKRVTDGLPA